MSGAGVLNDLPRGWEAWSSAWQPALDCWSRFTRLHAPAWCMTAADATRKGMPKGIFAMIRLVDHEVVLCLEQIERAGVKAFPKEILAHEIGHHVYCPADLRDNARLLARVRQGLPSVERMAPLVSNLYADLLINDRLQRQGLDLAGVYRAIRAPGNQLWTLYMRSYELLWALPRQTLALGEISEALDVDAQLAARVIRAYSADWVRGAGRFAALLLPYVLADQDSGALGSWLDLQKSGAGGLPDGLSELDDDEGGAILHPALDPELSGIDANEREVTAAAPPAQRPADAGGRKSNTRYRGPLEYARLLESLDTGLSEAEVASKYYRERALPHLIRFPTPEAPTATEPSPEGLSVWDVGSPLTRVDWLQSVIRSPRVVVGVTTVARNHAPAPVREKRREPVDLYIGIDCSGSMPNPRHRLSYPVLCGAIVGLSALRAGARVQVVLSGEPGQALSTPGFVSSDAKLLAVLTDYLGTGYAFGIGRLREAFPKPRKPPERRAHILLITDSDIFSMLENDHDDSGPVRARGRERVRPRAAASSGEDAGRPLTQGWEIARAALANASGGGTCVLNLPPGHSVPDALRLEAQGWAVHRVADWDELVRFARDFSRQRFERAAARRRAGVEP